MDDNIYQHLIGKLMFLTHSYLDLLFFVTLFNHYMQQPQKCLHLVTLCGILHYLCHYPSYDIYFFNGSKPKYFRYTLMQTMIFISMIASRLAYTFLHLDLHQFLRVAIRNNPPLVALVVNQNTMHFLIAHVRLFGLIDYLQKWAAL